MDYKEAYGWMINRYHYGFGFPPEKQNLLEKEDLEKYLQDWGNNKPVALAILEGYAEQFEIVLKHTIKVLSRKNENPFAKEEDKEIWEIMQKIPPKAYNKVFKKKIKYFLKKWKRESQI